VDKGKGEGVCCFGWKPMEELGRLGNWATQSTCDKVAGLLQGEIDDKNIRGEDHEKRNQNSCSPCKHLRKTVRPSFTYRSSCFSHAKETSDRTSSHSAVHVGTPSIQEHIHVHN
jgi:hypothetical protein